MFCHGLSKTAMLRPMKMLKSHSRIDPVTSRDALGASKALPFNKPLKQFASGDKPRMGWKPLSQAGGFGKRMG